MQSSERNWHYVGNCGFENAGRAGGHRAEQCRIAAAGAQSLGHRRKVRSAETGVPISISRWPKPQRASQQADAIEHPADAFRARSRDDQGIRRARRESDDGAEWDSSLPRISGPTISAFRYETTTVAIILGDTAEKEALLAVEKLRKLVADVRMPGRIQSLPLSAGLAEAVMRSAYDPVDVVTEVINRAEQALHDALTQGAGTVLSLAPNLASAAVA